MDRFAPLSPSTTRRLLEAIVLQLPIGAAVFDRELRYLAYNQAWFAAHGAEDADVLGKSHYEVFPEIREEWRQVLQRCLAGATERREIDVFDRADGGREYLRWLVAPWQGESGEIGGIVIYAENITEQVATSKRLEEREGLIRDLFEQSPVGLNLCTMDGLWLQSNPAFRDIIGYSKEEADGGLTYWQLTPREYDAEEAVQLAMLRSLERYGPYEKEFIRKDRTRVPVRLNGFIVEHEGERFIWSLIEDMTAQRALEAKLEEERIRAIQASKLATMGEMAASFAHEINNPLGIISAFAHLLEEAIATGNKPDIDEALAAIQVATDRAGKIVRGLGRFARETDRDPPERMTVAALVADALVLCRARIESHGVSLDVDTGSDASVEGSGIELSQVLVNLLNNAFDAARGAPKGWIRLSVDAPPDSRSVSIVVEDSGPGVPKDAAEAIFRSFYTTKKPGEGTGLGLSISRSIAERHGGTLTCDTSGPRTRFVVVLPRCAP